MNVWDAPAASAPIALRERVGWSLLVAVGVGIVLPVVTLLALQVCGIYPRPVAVIAPCVAVAVLTIRAIINERN